MSANFLDASFNCGCKCRTISVGGKSGTRGVLSTCNYIARQYGVSSAMPTSVALRKCPNLIIVPGRMDVYKATSAHLREIFERYTDKIEPLSLDEAYLDVTENKVDQKSATILAEQIRADIFKETSLTCSAGVSFNKFLAKVASDINKPNGIKVITPQEAPEFLDNLNQKS